jgi:hypothetical protein
MRKLLLPGILISVLIIYLLFPTTNSTNDAYAYAAYVRYGSGLLEPFHLLYNVVGFVLYTIFTSLTNINVLSMMKALNAVAAVYCLCLLYKILMYFSMDERHRILLVLFCGFSFGVWRFATENETYIIPIVFSLLASYYYFNYLNKPSSKTLIMAGFFAAFACLFHVVHVFWWVGLLIGVMKERKSKAILLYMLSSLFVPLAYLIIIPIHQNCSISFNCLWSFFSGILQGDTVQYKIGWDNFYLGAINFARTFYQVHGNIFLLVKKNSLFILPGIISIVFALLALKQLVVKKMFLVSKFHLFVFVHIIIFILQLLFAVYSKGNAEFMVMLPFLVAIISCAYIKFETRFLVYIMVSLFIWNISYGILPSHYADFNQRQKLLGLIKNSKKSIFMLEQYKEVQNQIFYQTGIEDYPCVVGIPKNEYLMKKLTERAAQKGESIYTDYYGKPRVINRYALTQKLNFKFMETYQFAKTDSFENFYGKIYIYKVLP